MRRTGWFWWAGVGALALLLGGYLGLHRPAPHAVATVPDRPARATTTAPVPAPAASSSGAPATTAFRVTTLEGSSVQVPDGHPVVLYFMSAQCASCAQGEQQLSAFVRRLPPGVQVLSLDVTPSYDPASAVLAMARDVGATWPQAYATVPIMEAYNVTQLDQLAVVNGAGRIVYDGPLPSNASLLALVHQALSS
jgi:thiol-disulfide isomerase/thioredoxin